MTGGDTRGARGSRWSIVEYAGRDGLLRLETDWRRLIAAMPNHGLAHGYEVHLAIVDQLQADERGFTCLALDDGERVRAICPLEPRTVRLVGRQLRAWTLPMGTGDTPADVICPPDEEAERQLLPLVCDFLAHARGARRWFVVERALDDSAVRRCLRHFNARPHCADFVPPTDMIDCDRSYDELFGDLSKNFRGNLRKARNKLAALPNVRFERASDPASLETAFKTFLDVEASGWKGDAGTRSSVSMKPRLLAFYRALIALLGPAGFCEVNALHAEGRCIASQFCVRVDAEYAVLKIGFDERYARVAPGQLLLERTLQQCCGDPGIRRVNLISDATWHRDWRPDVVRSYAAYVGLGRWSGRPLVELLRARLVLGPRIRKLVSRSKRTERA